MRAIVKTAPGPGAAIRDAAEPVRRRSDQVIVQPVATSICGTDYHVYSWDAWSAGRVKPPRIMGHEFAGRVVEVGPDVVSLRPGDYVSGESHCVCGVCRQCRTGQAHVCEKTRILGVDTDGCFADLVVIPEASLWRNDAALPPELACIQDPLGNAVHATLAGEIAGQSVAVLGCGPIGVMAIAVARACGASAVYATDTKPYRLDLARKLGADEALNVTDVDPERFLHDATHGYGVDVTLEMSGAPAAIRQAMRVTRRGGRVSLMGIPSQKVELDVAEDMVFRGLDIRCIVGRRLYETWDTMHALLASGRLDVSAVITHQMGFCEYETGMNLMGEGQCGKVVLHMGAGAA